MSSPPQPNISEGAREHLARARDILERLRAAIAGGDRWPQIERAWRILQGEAAAPIESPPSAPAVAAPAVAVPAVAAPAVAAPAVAAPAVAVPAVAAPAVGAPSESSPWAAAASPPPPPVAARPPVARPAEIARPGELARPLHVAPPAVVPAPIDDEDDDGAATLPVDSDHIFLARDVLPFVQAKDKAPPPAAAADDDPADLGSTAAVDADLLRDHTLPFRKVAPDDSMTEVAYEPTERLSSKHRPPPAGALPEHLEAMTIQEYAAMCAECAVHADWVEQIQKRYHVRSDEERAAVDRHFRDKMAADDELASKWRWHLAHYEAWARQQKG